ncbi:MAG TPA: type II secretion system F family protein [Gaiellaceae bacterium]|nr:type II secretion system F family protein [Gaiellaceae bacterium]
MIARLRRRRLLRGLPLAFAALVVVPAAFGAVRIQSVDTSSFPRVHATLVGPLGAATPQLTENGLPVVGYSATNLGREKSIVLALDRSQSMYGHPLTAAIDAARSFIAAAGARDHVGVVMFGHDAVALTRSTAAPADALSALGAVSIDTKSGTALYDAIALAASQLAGDARPGRAIVVVTDGRDVSSSHTLDQAIAAAHAAHAAVYTIGIGGPSFTPDALRRIASETGGSYRQATSAERLGGVYAALADELARTWQLSYLTAARPGARLRLSATVPGAGSAGTIVDVPGTEAGTTAPSSLIPSVGYSTAGTIVVGLTCGFLVLLACAFWFASQQGTRLQARIEPHVSTVARRPRARGRRGRAAARTQIADGFEHAFGELRQFKRLQLSIDRADLPLRAGELVALCAGSAFFFGLVAAAMAASALEILVVLACFGSLPVVYVSYRAARRIKQFENQLPDLLITIAASLKAGHSFRQGIQSVVDEGADPAAKEFRRVLTETQLGKPMDDALSDLAERIGSKNLTFVISAVTIQRQIGGALAGLFDMVADTVRQRQQFARKVKGLTAMGRMSAYVLIGLPFFIALVVTMMNPLYMSPLYHSATGQKMLVSGLVMIGIGSVVLKKIVAFRG